MKVITNRNEANCLDCGGFGSYAVMLENGSVGCDYCLSENLVFRSTGKPFQPIFGSPERTYQVNQYGPQLKDRRGLVKPWPMFKERRGTDVSLQTGLGRP